MYVKDYYTILEVQSSATPSDIKKAYRRLALQYHPDTSPNDSHAAAKFAAIKEAYEVLTDPSKKEYYLQQRWYDQSMGRRKKETIVTPASMLKQALELERYVSRLDHFRMDRYGLRDYIMAMISDDQLDKLKSFDEPHATNEGIIEVLLQCIKVLPLNLMRSIALQIEKLAVSPAGKEKINSFIQQHEKSNQRDRYRIWLILLATLVICLLIFFMSH